MVAGGLGASGRASVVDHSALVGWAVSAAVGLVVMGSLAHWVRQDASRYEDAAAFNAAWAYGLAWLASSVLGSAVAPAALEATVDLLRLSGALA